MRHPEAARPLSRADHDEMTRYVPAVEHHRLLREWVRLHNYHIVAVETGDLYAACKLADRKYELYLESRRAYVTGTTDNEPEFSA